MNRRMARTPSFWGMGTAMAPTHKARKAVFLITAAGQSAMGAKGLF
jgi:hypothetical protein